MSPQSGFHRRRKPIRVTNPAASFNQALSNYSDVGPITRATDYNLVSMMGFNGVSYSTTLKSGGAIPIIYKDIMRLGNGVDGLGSSLAANYAVAASEVSAAMDLGLPWYTGQMGDVGAAEYQTKWVDNAIVAAASGGFTGVFLDNALWKLSAGYPAAYPNQAAWQPAMKSFVVYAAPRLRSAGLTAICNIGSASDTLAVPIVADWLQYMSGYMDEGLARASTDHTGALDSGVRIDNQLANITACQSMAKLYMGSIPADDDDLATQRYGMAQRLLIWDGGPLVTAGTAGTVEPDLSYYGHEVWSTVYDAVVALGKPTALKQGSLAAGYYRLFEHGEVRLNGTAGSLTIDGQSVAAATAVIG